MTFPQGSGVKKWLQYYDQREKEAEEKKVLKQRKEEEKKHKKEERETAKATKRNNKKHRPIEESDEEDLEIALEPDRPTSGGEWEEKESESEDETRVFSQLLVRRNRNRSSENRRLGTGRVQRQKLNS